MNKNKNNILLKAEDNSNPVKAQNLTTFRIAVIALMCALTCTGGFIKIPLPSLDITLQTFFACMAGLLLGKKWGTASQAIYAFIGLAGVPVFSRGGGVTYIFQPSFGFILGFILCAFLCGIFRDVFYSKKINTVGKVKVTDYFKVLLICIIGIFGVYIIGAPYMFIIQSVYLGFNHTAIIASSFSLPLYFLGDMLSLILLVLAAPILLRRVPKLLMI